MNMIYFTTFDALLAGLEQLQGTGVQLSERLASLGIMGDQFRSALKPLEYQNTMEPRVLMDALNWDPIMPRGTSSSDSGGKSFQSGLHARTGKNSETETTRLSESLVS